ncbi:MAG: pseudouridine synthase [Prosthecobacter sp.]|nr:pseudouridine synthase [Prosthecobacter sp.]
MAATGLARALSKLGYCSRSQAVAHIRAGRVTLNGRVCRDPEKPVHLGKDAVAIAGAPVEPVVKVYLMLNKPRGLVTTASDEQGRATVYECLQGAPAAHLAPVGRLDKASEGLLLFTNDNTWANRITDPVTHIDKTYHVQVSCLLDEALLERLRKGVSQDEGTLRAKHIQVLRSGQKNTWLEIVLDEGRNRHIRRLLEALEIEVLRLVRVAIGPLQLGDLAKGQWRHLTQVEVVRCRGK